MKENDLRAFITGLAIASMLIILHSTGVFDDFSFPSFFDEPKTFYLYEFNNGDGLEGIAINPGIYPEPHKLIVGVFK